MAEYNDFDDLDSSFDVLDGSLDEGYTGTIPGSLLALCILTLVGSGLILIKDFFTYYMYAALDSLNEGISRTNPNVGSQELDNFLDSLSMIYILEVISCLGCIAGAILMMKMRKVGFVLYVISTVIYGLGIIWFWFISMKLSLNEGMLALLILYMAAPIAFIIMYSAHRKYMN